MGKKKIRQIVTHFTDNDLYTFTVMYYILQTYPRAEVKYSFFDRNHTRYPKGFAELLQEQINGMADVIITDEEIEYMRHKCYFLPDWFFVFLKGYRFNPNEVKIFQDQSGYLTINIEGKWHSTVMWEMPILSTISELMHIINGEIPAIDMKKVYNDAYEKGVKAFTNGIVLSDMGTRRRTSFEVQRTVLAALNDAFIDCKEKGVCTGNFVGSSNVWFAKEFGLKPIGTMSHQIISAEECVSGVFECNYQVMDKWSRCFNGDVGIYLPDCFGHKVFLDNFAKRLAKEYDGLRIDSGVEEEETEGFIKKYQSLGIDPATKSIVYSNALTIDRAIEIHKWLNGRMKDSYGIGTHLCADVSIFYSDALGTPVSVDEVKDGKTIRGGHPVRYVKLPYSNIVIKLIGFRITESREWLDGVKLSNNKGKTLGNPEKCAFLLKQIGS